mgnify:FL=1
MAEHKHGEMDVEVQEKTFEGFMQCTIKTVIVIFAILLFLLIFAS